MVFRRFWLLLAASILVLAGQGCFGSSAPSSSVPSGGGQPADSSGLVAEISSVKGTVILTRNGEEIGAGVHTRVQTGDRVETKEGSEVAIEFYKGSRMALDQNSSIEITETSIDPSNWKKQVVYLQLLRGRVWSRALKLLELDSSYQVEYEQTIASVRGTAFLMTGNEHRLTIDQFDGTIELSGAVQGRLEQGFTVNYNTRNPPTNAPAATMPTPDDTRNDAFVREQLKADQTFAAEAAKLRRDAGMIEDVSGVGLEAGPYTLDEPGVEHSGFTYVLIEAVDGKTMDDGTVVMLDDSDQQFKAYAVFMDANGERRVDVTDRGVVWQLEDPSVGVMGSTGLFHSAPGFMGDVYLVARYNDGTHEHSGMMNFKVFTQEYIRSILPDFGGFF